jgi:hypothetical protein
MDHEIFRARLVLHFLRLIEEPKHRLHIDKRLRDLAIDGAEQIERLIQLHQDGIAHHERADSELSARDAHGGQYHHETHADRHDHGLAGVQNRKRYLSLDGRAREFVHRFLEAARFVTFVVEIFDGLVVQQAVDGLGVRLAVAVIHLAPEPDPPACDREGEPDIAAHHGERRQRDPDIELPDHDRGEQQQLEEGRENAEQREG